MHAKIFLKPAGTQISRSSWSSVSQKLNLLFHYWPFDQHSSNQKTYLSWELRIINNAFCFSFQIRNPILYEVNGTSQYCKSRYSTGSLKISPVSEELGPLLERPIEFEYKEGKVGKIYCEDEEPEYILNIKRGILSILHHNFTKPELSVDNEEPRMYKNWEVVYFL